MMFFVSWQLWEKMTFCLSLAILVAVFLGLCKNLHTRWRLLNDSTVEERLLDPTPHMIEAQAAASCEVPFGIRALENGTEIEGIWISRSNTPVPSCPGSPSSSIAGSTASSYLDEPTTPSYAIMENPTIRVENTSSQSYYSPSKRISDSGSVISWAADTYGGKQVEVYRPRPLSSSLHQKYGHEPIKWYTSDGGSLDRKLHRTMTSSSDNIHKPNSNSTLPTSPSGSSEDTQSLEERSRLRDSTEGLLPTTSQDKGKGRMLEPGADLGLMYSHRLSHVAETGQLMPRSKRSPVPSGEWSHAHLGHREPKSREHPPISYPYRRISRSAPTTPTVEKKDPFSMVDLHSALAAPAPASIAPLRTEHEPALELPQTSTARPTVPLSGRFYAEQSGAISAIATLSRPEAVHSAPAFEHDRGAKILRKVNEGFEILRPGTLPNAENSDESSNLKHEKIRRHSRRLSKERPSTERKRNSFIEVIYGNELRPR